MCFQLFPYAQLVQYMQVGKWDNANYPLLDNGGYIRGEKTYQLLSLFTKTLILWQVSSSVMRPGNDAWNNATNGYA